jgi:hypothetical protein
MKDFLHSVIKATATGYMLLLAAAGSIWMFACR